MLPYCNTMTTTLIFRMTTKEQRKYNKHGFGISVINRMKGMNKKLSLKIFI